LDFFDGCGNLNIEDKHMCWNPQNIVEEHAGPNGNNFCQCGDCMEYTRLQIQRRKLSEAALDAARVGNEEEVNKLVNQWREVDKQMNKVGVSGLLR
jgi:hypothetical protein